MIPPRGLGFKTNSRPIARFAKLGHYLFAFCDTVPEGKRGNPEVNCRNQAITLIDPRVWVAPHCTNADVSDSLPCRWVYSWPMARAAQIVQIITWAVILVLGVLAYWKYLELAPVD